MYLTNRRAVGDMKRVVCLIAIVVFASHRLFSHEGGARDTAGIAETICITNEFAVDIEYPNFVVSVLAHIAGAHTDSLKYVEWDIKSPLLYSFLLHLTDEDEHRWFEIASDTAFPSFVKLPLEDRTGLAPSALTFFRNALQFFRTTGTDTLRATFVFGQDTLGAIVYHLSESTDTGSVVTTVSQLETWNEKTGEPYNNAEVMAVTRDGYTAFQTIKIFLKKKEILFRLTSVRVTVERSKY